MKRTLSALSDAAPVLAGLALSLLAFAPAGAAEAERCAKVRLSDPGWTDIAAANGVASVVLQGLGYEPDVKTLSVPIGFEALKTGDIDVFLGNWLPAQRKFRDDADASGAVVELVRNLEGAKFTLAVTEPGAALGVKDFADLAAHRAAFDGRIYGIEPGAPANQSIAKIIETNKFGLGDWRLMESSEQAMLAQVRRNEAGGKPTVFLAWAPHPMNIALKIAYLSGGDEEFGPDFGGASVHTLANKAWSEACPNLTKLFSQLTFTVDQENLLIGEILDQGRSGAEAAKAWIAANPDALEVWLDGVTTRDGAPGAEAVRASVQ